MENVRKEFEEWVMVTMGVDCSVMQFGAPRQGDKEQYIDENDEDGAVAVSAMLYAYKAGKESVKQ